MGLIALLPYIDQQPEAVFVLHERSEKLIPFHTHQKGQLSYVEGGLAYVTILESTYIVPARHYFWIPPGIPHQLKLGHSATVLRSLYYYAFDDHVNPFFSQMGIYPAPDLLIEMISFTERWDEQHIDKEHPDFIFLAAIKHLLPSISKTLSLITLPETDDERMQEVVDYLAAHLAEPLTLKDLSRQFNMSERSLSRLFQTHLHISFLQYLKTLRMIKAIELLLKTNKPINEISYLVGYDTVAAFSNTFYSFTRSRPSDLRHIK